MMETNLTYATDKLKLLCEQHQIDASHGVKHATAVLTHAQNALNNSDLGDDERLAVQLGALLHDADDRKYFAHEGLVNATRILKELEGQCGLHPTVSAQVLRMIELVSCSKNGNSFPADCEMNPHLLWPRWADRLEAIGEIGIVRCYQYTNHTNAPLCTKNTPKPTNAAEVYALATPERFEAYQSGKAVSASFMDHFYDKLIQITRPPAVIVQNKYFEQEMVARCQPLVDVCLAYGRSGQVPVAEIEALLVKYA